VELLWREAEHLENRTTKEVKKTYLQKHGENLRDGRNKSKKILTKLSSRTLARNSPVMAATARLETGDEVFARWLVDEEASTKNLALWLVNREALARRRRG
jgi:hypothetical protein